VVTATKTILAEGNGEAHFEGASWNNITFASECCRPSLTHFVSTQAKGGKPGGDSHQEDSGGGERGGPLRRGVLEQQHRHTHPSRQKPPAAGPLPVLRLQRRRDGGDPPLPLMEYKKKQ